MGWSRAVNQQSAFSDNVGGVEAAGAGSTLAAPGLHPACKRMLAAFAEADYGCLRLEMPEGGVRVFGTHNSGVKAGLRLYQWEPLRQLLTRGDIGFAESYMARQWDSDALPALLTWGLMNAPTLEKYLGGQPWHRVLLWLHGLTHANSLGGSRRNILKHYNLGNSFFALWLDPGMTYSCALFGGNTRLSLEAAQAAKYQRILTVCNAKPGDTLLEIGCGWGGFAELAAQQGLKVTAITLSEPQKIYAEARIRRAGLAGLVRIALQDYRQVEGQFDHIVSIGMFEHVGARYWDGYFKTIAHHLKPGGTAVVQSITVDEAVFEKNGGRQGFIEVYIFPGGKLPSKTSLRQTIHKAGLTCTELFAFGQDYALTLQHWLANFDARQADISQLGYEPAFIRMWRFYLAASIASFVSRRTDVVQVTIHKAYTKGPHF